MHSDFVGWHSDAFMSVQYSSRPLYKDYELAVSYTHLTLPTILLV